MTEMKMIRRKLTLMAAYNGGFVVTGYDPNSDEHEAILFAGTLPDCLKHIGEAFVPTPQTIDRSAKSTFADEDFRSQEAEKALAQRGLAGKTSGQLGGDNPVDLT
jgi:hypothetical protein